MRSLASKSYFMFKQECAIFEIRASVQPGNFLSWERGCLVARAEVSLEVCLPCTGRDLCQCGRTSISGLFLPCSDIQFCAPVQTALGPGLISEF